MKTRGQRPQFSCRIFHRIDESYHDLVSRAQFCENQGFDSVIVDDHVLYGAKDAAAPDPFTTLAIIGANTRKIKMGIMVTDLVRRNPAIVAQSLATLAVKYPVRIFLGLGTGDPMNQAPIGVPTDHRYSKLIEGLKILKLLWESNIQNPKTFKGKFYQLNEAYLQLTQEKHLLPHVYLAAFGPKMLRLAGKEASGWVPHCHTSGTYKQDLDIIMRSRQNKQSSSFHPAYYTLISMDKDSEKADKTVLGPAKYFLALIPEALKKIDPNAMHPGRIWEKMSDPRIQRDTIKQIASSIPDRDAFDTVIHGSPNDCIEQIDEYRRAGCEEFMLTFVSEGGLWATETFLGQIRYFKKHVLDYYRSNNN